MLGVSKYGSTHGMVSEIFMMIKAKFWPSDTTLELELDSALEQLKFSNANSYYNTASMECGGITFDLLLRAGVLKQDKEGSWVLAKGWNWRRVLYLFGDAKTIGNVAKFVWDMQMRQIAYTQGNLQAGVFTKVMSVVMDALVDWYTSLNMLQLIYTLYYGRLLDSCQELLKFKIISKDIRSCYFQADPR